MPLTLVSRKLIYWSSFITLRRLGRPGYVEPQVKLSYKI